MRNVEKKPKDYIIDEKTFQPRLREGKKKPKVYGERKDLVRNKVLFQFLMGSNCQCRLSNSLYQENRSSATYQLLVLLKTKLTRILFLLPQFSMRFVVLFAGHLCFRFAGSLTVNLAINGTVSKCGDVVVNFSGWFLWKVLTIF